ncbi:MAG: SDR family NAD(P)-dependent oxidoreductase [Deltaproteobacteria bacterium]|nr:SDR family NAD(P)-dependent oxidoreductase [Deltaproteobacteria bacterium]
MAAKVWMITGASRGIGAEIAKAALATGDKLIATGRETAGFEQYQGNENVITIMIDVTNEEQVKSGVQQGLEHFGRIDVLVNNAGFGVLGAIEETGAEVVERVYRTNVFGLLNVTRAVLPAMRKQRSGRIINLSSLGGYRASAGWGVYCSTKFAVEGITEALHDELAPLGIHATVVEPGFVRTDFMDNRSLSKVATQIDDYADTVGKTRTFATAGNHQQPGDPVKLAQAIVKLANEPEPPLRLPLGKDAVERIAEKNAFVESETAKWRTLSESTSF